MLVLPQSSKLNAALLCFQNHLEREVEFSDPNQVHGWAESLRRAFDELAAVVEEQRQCIHRKLFRSIAEQGNSQRCQIQEFEETDAHVNELIEVVKAQLIVLSMQSSADVEPRIENQSSDDELPLQTIDRGTELIQCILDQEASVASWFAEAFVAGA